MLGPNWLRLVGGRGFAPLHLGLVVLLVLPLGIVAGEVSAWAAEVLPSFSDDMLADMSELPLWLVFVAGCLLPALGEELFFRGFLSRGLIGNCGLLEGTLLTSVLFGLLHIDPVQACGTFVLGLGFQYIFWTTKTLALPIVAHLLNNMLAFVMLRLATEPFGVAETVSETPAAPAEHVPLLVALAALAALIPLLLLLYQTRARWTLPDGSVWTPGYISGESPPPALGAAAKTRWPNGLLLLAAAVTYGLLILSLVLYEL